jgi:metal-responsive CopG/Arc/MetJ family transcriptional regulator
MKTAISIPDPLFKATERLAKRLRLSRSEVFQRAVQAFVQDHDDSAITSALDEVYGSNPEDSRLDPVLARLQASSLRGKKW